MKRFVVVLLTAVLGAALLCLGASQKLTNQTGSPASGVTLTFSEEVRVTSYDRDVFSTHSPASGESESFTFSGGTLAAGGTFQVTWSPDNARVRGTQWATSGAVTAGGTDSLPPGWDTAYSYTPDFYVGGWVCDYLAAQKWGGKWKTSNPLKVMKDNGFEWVKVGLTTVSSLPLSTTPPEQWSSLQWRSEYWSSLEYAAEILTQAASYGLRLNVVLYLSDESAHAGRQSLAAAWKGLSMAELQSRIESYCYETGAYFRDRGLNVEIWDIGNEIEWGVAGYRVWEAIAVPRGVDPTTNMSFLRKSVWSVEAELLGAAIRGVRRAAPDARVVLHVNSLDLNPEIARSFFQTMVLHEVDFDLAGLSLPYPSSGWRAGGTSKSEWFQELEKTIQFIASLGKEVLISEGAYPSTATGISGQPLADYPYTPEGQASWIHDALRFARNSPHVKGFFYFYPDWFPGMNDPSPLDTQAYGLFASEGAAKPAMNEFQVNLSTAK